MNDFKNTMKVWVSLDDEIRSLKQTVKEKDKQKKIMEEKLVPYLQKENKLLVELGEGKGDVEVKTRVTRPALSKKKQEEVLSSFFDGNNTKASQLMEFMNQQKEIREKTCLTRKL